MNCDEYLDQISAALDGELSADERRALDEHLAGCPACAALFRELSGQSAALRGLDCEVPDGLTERILAGLPEQEAPGQKTKIIRWRRWASLAACLVLAVGIFALTRFDMPANFSGSTSSAENAAPQMEDPGYDDYDSSFVGEFRSADSEQGFGEARYLRVSWEDAFPSAVQEDPQKTDGSSAARLVTSVEELESLTAEFPEDDLTELLADYDAEYFESGRLIAVVVTENSGSVTHTVESVEPDGDGYSITIRRTVPEVVTDDMAAWLILIETDSGFDGGESLNVVISN